MQGTHDKDKHLDLDVYLVSLEDWHARLGHPIFSTIKKLVNSFQLPYSSSKQVSNKFEACCLGKLHCVALHLTNNCSSHPLQLIHSDVWGPAPMNSFSGFKYFVIFIDDYSLFT